MSASVGSIDGHRAIRQHADRRPAEVASNAPPVAVRAASAKDVPSLVALLDESAAAGVTLPRSHSELEHIWGGFLVAEQAGEIFGCGALDVLTPRLAEIRSVTVSPEAGGRGIGRSVVDALVDRADALGVETLCLLTRVPAFFARSGFFEVSEETLPENYIELAIRARGRTIEARVSMMRAL